MVDRPEASDSMIRTDVPSYHPGDEKPDHEDNSYHIPQSVNDPVTVDVHVDPERAIWTTAALLGPFYRLWTHYTSRYTAICAKGSRTLYGIHMAVGFTLAEPPRAGWKRGGARRTLPFGRSIRLQYASPLPTPRR